MKKSHGKEQRKSHRVSRVLPESIAEELGIEAGDLLLEINGTQIEDIFDYQFLTEDTYLEVLVEKPDGEQWLLEIEKEYDEDLGIEFENGLMDEYRRCRNNCIFCFIDQMPPGMRDTLYFKDDDSRLSFLQGNYVTLTNMSDHDIDRICRYHLSPINISFHTMNPALRCRMLNNRFAGEALKKVDRFYEAGIVMNGQIVLCKGINDGAELEYSIRELMKYLPLLQSVSVVPVGLTRYREGLYPLEAFTGEDARNVLEIIHRYQRECYEKWNLHFIHASDEWYILAGQEMPEEERYDGYLQLENGVGMVRLLLNEFDRAYLRARQEASFPSTNMAAAPASSDAENHSSRDFSKGREISLATGKLMYPYIRRMAKQMEDAFPWLTVHVYAIRNDFFGEKITVSGLLTGDDIRRQLTGRALGECLLLPENVLRSGEDVFLDDKHLGELEEALKVPVQIVKASGGCFVEALLGRKTIQMTDCHFCPCRDWCTSLQEEA